VRRVSLLAVTVGAALGMTAPASAQVKRYALESTEGLRLHNVAVEPATVAHFRNPTIDTSPGR
jgi:hypothetical protein